MPSPADQRPSPSRIVFLDGIRALAALFVVAHHAYLAVYPGFPENTGPWWLGWLMFGHFAVAVFIVLSGFSLTLGPARSRYQIGSLRRYLSRRAWRILPPYWVAVILSSVLVILFVRMRMEAPLNAKDIAVHLLVLQTVVGNNPPNGALWSIAVEWQLYFVFPVFLWLRRRSGGLATAVTGVLLVWLVYQLAVHVGVFARLLHLSPQFAALFVFGIVAAGVTARERPAGRTVPWGWIAIAVCVMLVVLLALVGTERVLGDNLYWADLGVGLVVACSLAALVRREGLARRALEQRWLVGVGHFSYSLYLTHGPLLLLAWLFVVQPLGLSQGASLALMLFAIAPVLVAFSYGFYRLFERPFINRRAGSLRLSWNGLAKLRPSALRTAPASGGVGPAGGDAQTGGAEITVLPHPVGPTLELCEEASGSVQA